MSGSTFGNKFKITTWGESHGKALGVVVDGCPAGLPLTEDDIQVYLNRRRPGFSQFSTPRKESDQVEILSGVFEGKTTGTPISLMVRNTSQRSGDYGDIATYYRPGHADYTFDQKYGFRDYRGGGRSSGRETIGRVAAGAIAAKILKKFSIRRSTLKKIITQISASRFFFYNFRIIICIIQIPFLSLFSFCHISVYLLFLYCHQQSSCSDQDTSYDRFYCKLLMQAGKCE